MVVGTIEEDEAVYEEVVGVVGIVVVVGVVGAAVVGVVGSSRL